MADNLVDQIQLNQQDVEPELSESPVIVNKEEDSPNDKAVDTTAEAPKGEPNQEEEEKYIPNDTDKQATKPIEEHEQKEPEESILLQRIYDRDQQIPKIVHNKDDPNHVLNTVDKDWKYNITLGDLELRRITHYDGTQETLWFPMETYPDEYYGENKENNDKKKKKKEKPPRKVFIALKVKRVSAVDNIAETFRMRFHIYFNWLPTETDYKSLYQASKEAKAQNKPEILMEWEPRWYPHLEFQNMIEEHLKEWEEYPEEGRFRVQLFKAFGQKKGQKMKEGQFDCTKAKFIRAKLECEMTFAEELELQSFPFDCQDLSCIIHERTTGGVRCIFLPELRKPKFGAIDPRYSVIDEWDLETAIIEFGDADSAASRSRTSYAMIVLRLKVKRRWKVFFANIVLLMACISMLALTAFSLGPDDLGDRLNLLITLILTAVAFSYVVFDTLPNVPYLTFMDKYILGSYGFLVALMIETSMIRQPWLAPDVDGIVFWLACIWLFLYNVGFVLYGIYLRRDEESKLEYSSDQVEKEVNLSRPALRFDYTRRARSGFNGRLLSFIAYTVATDHMDLKQKQEILQKQEKMEKLYETQTTRHGYNASEIPESPDFPQKK